MTHMLRQFSFRELCDIDGNRLEIAFDNHLKRCLMDIQDRPAEKKARKITMTVEVTPNLDVDGMCESVDTQVQFKDSIPERKSKVYNLGLRSNGVATYHPEVLDNHAQMALDLAEEEKDASGDD